MNADLPEGARHQHPFAREPGPRGGLAAMSMAALGVVFGDIGTSPLYALNQIFFSHRAFGPTPENVIGCVSLVVWAITLVVVCKYLIFVMRADNDGEGGVFALYGLLHTQDKIGMRALLWLLMLAAGLLLGDGVITPAISVLSAIEGLRVAAPSLGSYVVPITIAVLTVLFSIQHKGTSKVGLLFGPIVLVWFVAIAALGASQLARHPEILWALDPRHGLHFLEQAGLRLSLLVLGGVMLVVTGGEALYADLGHFGKRPIRLSWMCVVYPALLLSYLGQGAYLLSGAEVREGNVFFSLVPQAALLPMVVLATFATIIASQALISGAFSLASQASALGLFPRIKIVHTHHRHEGQTYSPFINWALYLGCVLLVWKFASSTALASAYGLAVSGDMLATSIAMSAVARLCWRWPLAKAWLLFGAFAAIDLIFLSANSLKFLDGGYVPMGIGIAVFTVMATWRWGRKATFAAYSSLNTMTMGELLELKRRATSFIDRNVILMVPKPLRSTEERCPALLQLFWERYGQLPRNLIFLEVMHRKVPYVHGERYHITVFERVPDKGSILSVTVNFGFMETPNIEHILESLARHHQIDLSADPRHWLIHSTSENIMPAKGQSWLAGLRFRLFSLLRQVSRHGHYYYGLGDSVQLSLEILPVKLR